MRIAQIVCHFPPDWGGIATAVIYMSRELVELGHDVTVITPLHGSRSQIPDYDFPFRVERLKPLVSSGRAAVLPQLLWCLKGYDIIHLHYPFFGSAEIVAAAKILNPLTRMKLFYHMDAIAGGLKEIYFRLYARTVMPLLLRQADEITLASFDYIRHSDAAGYLRRHPEKFDEVPYGVDLDLFKPDLSRVPAGGRTILFVGSLTKQGYFKGLENLMRAFTRIIGQVAHCRLVVVGHGEMEKYYRDLARSLGVADRVEFVTGADDAKLVECYQSCDVLVLPPFNRNEAFGIVLLEAMACAKPVIASNLPGVRSVFEDGKQGLLVEPGDIDDLEKKILVILNDEELARRLGEAGRERVEKKYTWAGVAESLSEIYNRT